MKVKRKNIIIALGIIFTGLAGFLLFIDRSHKPIIKNTINKISINADKEMTSGETPVFLYFGDRKKPYLVSEERLLSHSENPVDFSRAIIHALIKGSQNSMVRTISADTLLRTLYITKNKTAYADFSQEIRENHPGGSQMEYLTIYSIVNSLVLNVPEIENVKILIEGREFETLAGHIDIRYPLPADMLLVR